MKHFIFGRSNAVSVQFFRYVFVGGTSALVDLAIFSVLVTILGIHYALAAFVGYMCGLAWNHFLSVTWVFQSKHRRTTEVAMVFCIALGGLLLTWLLLYLMIDLSGLHPVLAKALSQVLVLFWNFGMRKVYVFH